MTQRAFTSRRRRVRVPCWERFTGPDFFPDSPPEQHLPAIAATRSLRLVAVYSRSSRSVKALAQAAKKYAATAHDDLGIYCDEDGPEAGLEALLERDDVDTVVMALPIPAQPALIEKAWRAGKSVISEKPVSAGRYQSLCLLCPIFNRVEKC